MVSLAVAAVVLAGAAALHPCAADAPVTVLTTAIAQKSCHRQGAAKPSQEQQDEKEQKREKQQKPCCALHCFSPRSVVAVHRLLPPQTLAVRMYVAEQKLASFELTPPLPPPRA
jgi:hypothetical protein